MSKKHTISLVFNDLNWKDFSMVIVLGKMEVAGRLIKDWSDFLVFLIVVLSWPRQSIFASVLDRLVAVHEPGGFESNWRAIALADV